MGLALLRYARARADHRLAGPPRRPHRAAHGDPRPFVSRGRRRPAWGKLAGIAVLLVAVAASWRYTPLRDYITAERMVTWADAVRATPWAPFAIIAAYTPAA